MELNYEKFTSKSVFSFIDIYSGSNFNILYYFVYDIDYDWASLNTLKSEKITFEGDRDRDAS